MKKNNRKNKEILYIKKNKGVKSFFNYYFFVLNKNALEAFSKFKRFCELFMKILCVLFDALMILLHLGSSLEIPLT